MAKIRKRPELKVVFDTNAIHNQTGSYLLRHEVYDLISAHASHTDLAITWYLPEVVRHERQYQMVRNALELLPSVEKLEKILGHNLNITREIVERRVAELIDQQIAATRIQLLRLAPEKISWHEMMLQATYRRPPFSSGEKEKGFRDALVVEAFVQLVRESPATSRICRLALVSGDELLKQAVTARLANATNLHILPTLEELKGLLNTLASEVTEEFVNSLKCRAETYFFDADNHDSLYYRLAITDALRAKFARVLRSVPTGATEVEIGQTRIGSPRFNAKQGQRVQWVTRLTVEVTAYRRDTVPALDANRIQPFTLGLYDKTQPLSILAPGHASLESFATFAAPAKGLGFWATDASTEQPFILGPPPFTKVALRTGEISFEVMWSVHISTSRRAFSSPTLDDITHVDTTWQPAA